MLALARNPWHCCLNTLLGGPSLQGLYLKQRSLASSLDSKLFLLGMLLRQLGHLHWNPNTPFCKAGLGVKYRSLARSQAQNPPARSADCPLHPRADNTEHCAHLGAQGRTLASCVARVGVAAPHEARETKPTAATLESQIGGSIFGC